MKKILHGIIPLLCALGLLSVSAVTQAQQVATIDNGTSSFMTYNPISVGGFGFFGPPNRGTHIQILYTAAQIQAAGVTGPHMLDSIAWKVASLPNTPLKNYTIKVGSYSLNSLDNWDSTNLVTATSIPSYMPADTGWSWIPFSTPVFWNGFDNLIIDICSDTTTAQPSGAVYIDFPNSSDNLWYSSQSPNPLCNVYTGGFADIVQANIKFSFGNSPSCTGTPVTGIITPNDSAIGCAGLSQLLTLTNPPQDNSIIQWQVSADGGPWTDVAGANGAGYMAIASMANQYAQFRAKITCPGSSASSLSNVFTLITSTGASYASLPYYQDFENWTSRCAVNEIPDSNWTADPVTGEASWRREDQGASAGWQDDVTPLYYNPVSSHGAHSARFHQSDAPGTGSLALSLDCSTPGAKKLTFDYFNKTGTSTRLYIVLSKDGGASFPDTLATLNQQGVTGATWQPQEIAINSDSAHTVLKFVGYSNSYQSGDFDMGIDNLLIVGSCTDKPSAGVIDSTTVCQGQGFTLNLSGNTVAGGLTYLWESTTDGVNWAQVDTIESPTTAISQPTWFRCVVTCQNSGVSDTTAPRLIGISPFYLCYCNSGSTVNATYLNLGNVTMTTSNGADTLLNNGNPLPLTSNLSANKHYTNYTNVPAPLVYLDSTYRLVLTFNTQNGTNVSPQMGSSWVNIYADFNHDGVFDSLAERIYSINKPAGIYTLDTQLVIPSNALLGVTGLRIVVDDDYDSTLVNPCGPYFSGETEDYLININGHPCTGPIDAGTITASKTISCPGYPIKFVNSGYDQSVGPYNRVWQSSLNQTTWIDIAGSVNQDSINRDISATTWFRVKTTCPTTNDVAYSDTVEVNLNALCYCASYADGSFTGLADSSDIGSFKLANINNALVGGHLSNSGAVNGYTDYGLQDTILLKSDSTYSFTFDHILKGGNHADARVTMFIDYNGNGAFDLPDEKVFDGMSTSTTWHQTNNFTVPATVILNQPVGLRVVLNNDTSANAASETGCGIYTSGETEDYAVIFDQTTGIGNIVNEGNGITFYPNPTHGEVRIQYNGTPLQNVALQVINVVGQVIYKQNLSQLNDSQSVNLDLSQFAKGVYIVHLQSNGWNAVGKVVVQ